MDLFDDPVTETMARFIREIGLAIEPATLPAPTLLPGIAVADGVLRVDPARLQWPGDLLHEAWQAKRSLSDTVSNGEVDGLYERARSAGAIGGKLTGAGGGGFLLLCVPPEQQAEALMRIAVTRTTAKLLPQFQAAAGESGFVCAQVNPLRAADRECMLPMARRLHSWAVNTFGTVSAAAAGTRLVRGGFSSGSRESATASGGEAMPPKSRHCPGS